MTWNIFLYELVGARDTILLLYSGKKKTTNKPNSAKKEMTAINIDVFLEDGWLLGWRAVPCT